uniref:cytochrome b n=1 Tax=Arthurdendyus triangulatus TaxID=132421 RepID=UPI002E7A6702|nr:cytochrome b [Arthurdendyus triangulatus]WPY71421.1 cytochrome b [Arthurdendyus triangulatus]
MSIYNFRLDYWLGRVVGGLMVDLPSPKNISIFWNYGSLLGLFLVIQILTGVFLSFSYIDSVDLAFGSVDLIMRDVFLGSFVRLLHSNGATFFFFFLYVHMFRGLYFSTYLLFRGVWLVGCIIFVLSMAVAFFGYVLPWGNMSFWGATVITNLFSAIPYFGGDVVIWLWGGFSVSFPTLVRFFSFHFVFPFIILFFVIIHIFLLHETGSNNPLGLSSCNNKVSFHPYFSFNDLFVFFFYVFLFLVFSFGFPYLFMDVENFVEANALVTPVHIQPEWYFLAAYAVLRSIPNKLGGVLALVFFIAIYFLIPFFGSKGCTSFSYFFQILFFFWVFNFIILTWLGACSVEVPFLVLSRFSFLAYFLVFLFF